MLRGALMVDVVDGNNVIRIRRTLFSKKSHGPFSPEEVEFIKSRVNSGKLDQRLEEAKRVAARGADVDPLVRQLVQIRQAAGIPSADLRKILFGNSGQFDLMETGQRVCTLETLRSWAYMLGYDVALVPRDDDES
jgi:hypothetical protein